MSGIFEDLKEAFKNTIFYAIFIFFCFLVILLLLSIHVVVALIFAGIIIVILLYIIDKQIKRSEKARKEQKEIDRERALKEYVELVKKKEAEEES